MEEGSTVYPRDLPNKPLVEAIFELRWKLQGDAGGVQHDPAFRFLLGRFYDKVKADFSFVQDLPVAQVPEELTAYAVRHQFRRRADAWPVMQLGPGILTVNETKGYTWETFRLHIAHAIAALFEAYPSDLPQARFEPFDTRLRYINVVRFDPGEIRPLAFLKERLHVSIDVDAELSREPFKGAIADGASVTLNIPLQDLSGSGALFLTTGRQNGSSIVRWETIIGSSGPEAPRETSSLASWLDRAHSIAESWFFTLARGPLLEQFMKKG